MCKRHDLGGKAKKKYSLSIFQTPAIPCLAIVPTPYLLANVSRLFSMECLLRLILFKVYVQGLRGQSEEGTDLV